MSLCSRASAMAAGQNADRSTWFSFIGCEGSLWGRLWFCFNSSSISHLVLCYVCLNPKNRGGRCLTLTFDLFSPVSPGCRLRCTATWWCISRGASPTALTESFAVCTPTLRSSTVSTTRRRTGCRTTHRTLPWLPPAWLWGSAQATGWIYCLKGKKVFAVRGDAFILITVKVLVFSKFHQKLFSWVNYVNDSCRKNSLKAWFMWHHDGNIISLWNQQNFSVPLLTFLLPQAAGQGVLRKL